MHGIGNRASTLQTSLFWEMAACEAFPAPEWEGRQGAAAALVSREATVSLSPANNTVPQWLGTSHVNNSFLKAQTSADIRSTSLASTATPPPAPAPPGQTWRRVRTPWGSLVPNARFALLHDTCHWGMSLGSSLQRKAGAVFLATVRTGARTQTGPTTFPPQLHCDQRKNCLRHLRRRGLLRQMTVRWGRGGGLGCAREAGGGGLPKGPQILGHPLRPVALSLCAPLPPPPAHQALCRHCALSGRARPSARLVGGGLRSLCCVPSCRSLP